MKKILIAALLLLVLVSLIACGETTVTTTTDGTTTAASTTTPNAGGTTTVGVTTTPATTTTPTTTKPDENLVVTDDYTAVKNEFTWVSDTTIDFKKFKYFGTGIEVTSDINKDYNGYKKSYFMLGADGTETEASSTSVRKLGTIGAAATADDTAKTVKIVVTEVIVKIEAEYTSLTARAGSYVMFDFTTNCPIDFVVNVSTSSTKNANVAYSQDGISTKGSNGKYTGVAKCTVPYRKGETYYINICAGTKIYASIPVEITAAKYDSQYSLMFTGDWELIRDKEYLPNLVDLFYNVYPRLYARFAEGWEPKQITFTADKSYDGVAYCAGTQVVVSTAYANSNPNDLGFFSHEITHSVQQYSKLNYGGDAWWTENMANYGGFRYFHWGYSPKFVQIYNADDTSLQDWGYGAYGNNKWFFAYMDARYPTTKNADGTLKYGLIDSVNRLIKGSSVMLDDDPRAVGSAFNNVFKEITGYETVEALRLHYVDELKNGTWEFVGFGEYVDNFITEDIEGVPNPTYPMRQKATHGNTTNPILSTTVKEGTNLALNATIVNSSGEVRREPAKYLVDGRENTKWCCNDASKTDYSSDLMGIEHYITLDLGEVKTFNTYTMLHAGVKESAAYNTKEWEILISNDGENWTSIDYQKDQNANETSVNVGEQSARYVQIKILRADNNNAGTVRLYEFMLFNAQ